MLMHCNLTAQDSYSDHEAAAFPDAAQPWKPLLARWPFCS
jgi:hypothetical protein